MKNDAKGTLIFEQSKLMYNISCLMLNANHEGISYPSRAATLIDMFYAGMYILKVG